MSTELIINASLPETRIAMMENGEIQELLIERASGKGIVGNIYKGRVTRVLPGMQAAFVDIGLEKAAFLYVDDVFVHSEIWEQEEDQTAARGEGEGESDTELSGDSISTEPGQGAQAPQGEESAAGGGVEAGEARYASNEAVGGAQYASEGHVDASGADLSAGHGHQEDLADHQSVAEEELDEDFPGGDPDGDDDEEEDDDDHGPVEMGPGSDDDNPEGTVSPPPAPTQSDAPAVSGAKSAEGPAAEADGHRRHRRGRRGGKFRGRNDRGGGRDAGEREARGEGGGEPIPAEGLPENFESQVSDQGSLQSDRSVLGEEQSAPSSAMEAAADANRPEESSSGSRDEAPQGDRGRGGAGRPEFREPRNRDRRIRPKQAARSVRAQVNIQDLLKEGQEVIVQVAKDPISTKGARLTCHISLPGRHLVCMPTIDHVGVSRRIERDEERRRLREHVERYRPKNLGFIVRTASGKGQSERRIKQDIEYLSRLWNEIREKAAAVTAPALVYEDLNSVLRAIRDWVTEDIDKIVVDSRYHYNEIQKFVSHFMPVLKQKVELYHGDIPVFDAYGIATELSRALERKVWLKSGGYIVIDQAEALVAIDVNTGRYVGKKNLEDTILKTNLEAVQEIAYQLRLRNCGGIIILDLIDMEREENKHRVYRALEEALRKDRARPSILKISELGLVEMTRKRTRDTMVRALCESCSHCEGKGFIKSKQTVAYEALREIEREGIEKDMSKILVQAHAEVIDILAIDERETLDQLERRYRKQIYLQAVTDYHPEQFDISGDKAEKTRSHGGPARSQPERGREGQRADRGSRSSSSGGGDHRRGGRDQERQSSSRGPGGSGGGGGGERGGRDSRGGGSGGGRDEQGRGRDRNRGRGGQSHDRSGPSVEPRGRQGHGPDHRHPSVVTPVIGGEAGAVAPQAGPEDLDSQARFLSRADSGGPVIVEQNQHPGQSDSSGLSGSPGSDDELAGGNGNAAPQQDDFYDEEDRLAFLRAQAAQDAALARVGGSPDGNGQPRQARGPGRGDSGPRDGGGGGGAGRRNGRRGRRGRRGPSFGGGSNRPHGGGPQQ